MNNLKNNYLVSAIIPTHNVEKDNSGGGGLTNAIDSIINQSIGLENIELIIVDDASDDKITQQIILEYQSQYPDNIKPIFLKQNSGYPGKPRNIGIKNATSKYIIFSDDDDIYYKNAFKILYHTITQYNSDMVIGNSSATFNGINLPIKKQSTDNIINMNPLESQKNYDLLTSNTGCGSWGKIYNKEFLLNNNIKIAENTNLEDVDFYLKILNHAKKITLLPNEIVYNYNIYNNSSIHIHNIKLFNNMIKGMYDIVKIIEDLKINTNIIVSYLISQILLVFTNLNNSEKQKAILDFYNLEKYLKKKTNFKANFERKEVTILNNAIMQKKFQKAIFISHLYKKLYNNNFIQILYKKFR